MKKPLADDWQLIRDDLQYSERLKLYWHKGRVYDERSASHNGIIGMGYKLQTLAKEVNKNEAQRICC